MRIKRFLALVLACALTAGLLILPSSAARQPSAFPDITDEATAEAAEILRLLGIVSGTGSGNFEPGRTLTRAEFCKMAVEIMGNGDKVAAQMNRTVPLYKRIGVVEFSETPLPRNAAGKLVRK